MADTPKDQDELTEEEAKRRMDEALKRALGMPPKQHKPPDHKSPKTGDMDKKSGK